MESKKAQSELITTVLIILLVLAAIIIVWQVVVGVLNQGKTAVESGQECIGFSMNIAVASDNKTINVIPNKDVTSVRYYATGAMVNEDTNSVNALASQSYTSLTNVGGMKIKAAGKISNTWCDGVNEITAP